MFRHLIYSRLKNHSAWTAFVALVEIKLHKIEKMNRTINIATAQSDEDEDIYTNRFDGLDRQIDALVYYLYALSPAEIRIVESAAK